jgi:ribosome-associated protein
MVRHRISATLSVDDEDIVVDAVRASGPGGQNVNKVASAITLRLAVDRIAGLDAATQARLARLAGRRLSSDGVLVIKAQRHRTQLANREDAIERLLELLRAASIAPRTRFATRTPAAW